MSKTIYFINGLPRSGTTLLCNILCQNPRFHATATSGCMDVLFTIRNSWHTFFQHKASPCPQKLQNVLKSTIQAYYQDVEQDVIFDKFRGWLPYIELIEGVLEKKIKIIVPVRPVVDILASFEKLYRETSKVRQPPGEAQNYLHFQTIEDRCEYWMRKDQVVGLAIARLEDAIARGYSDRLFFVDYNKFTTNPTLTLLEIYDFLKENNKFDHDFYNVEQVTQEDDEINGFVNLHKIRKKVEFTKSDALKILGKKVYDKYAQ